MHSAYRNLEKNYIEFIQNRSMDNESVSENTNFQLKFRYKLNGWNVIYLRDSLKCVSLLRGIFLNKMS